MKKRALILGGFLVFVCLGHLFAREITWEEISMGELNIKTVLALPRAIYFGSAKGVFMSEDRGSNWRNVLLTKGQNKSVNFLAFDNSGNNSVFAATGNGLFYSQAQGRSWQRIFKGKNYAENDCRVVIAASQYIYLGTKQGLFVSNDKGRTWYRESGELAKSAILAIALDKNKAGHIYVACVDGVFKTKDYGRLWEKIFIARPTEKNDTAEEIIDDQDETERTSGIKYITLDQRQNYLYLATSKGIYQSKDEGLTWDALSGYGLLDQDIKCLSVFSDSTLYAVTKRGVFKYEQERWFEVSQGLVGNRVNFLDLDNQGNFYVASDKGLFKGSLDNRDDKILTSYSKDEPAIKDVQQAAIKYAEVEPEKIIKWRKQAARKALLPQVSIGIDRDSTDLWHWEGGSTTKTDDDILRRGRDSIDWDVSLSWNLAELIWNDDQTSIDARSRLMVQLRDDILDEVTKIYFERIRVKMELDNLSIEERKKRFEKELKLQELTASLDALTGGYFSEQLKKS